MGEILIPATNGSDDLVQIGAFGVDGVVVEAEERTDFIKKFWGCLFQILTCEHVSVYEQVYLFFRYTCISLDIQNP